MELNIGLFYTGLIAFFVSLFGGGVMIFLSRKLNIFIDRVDVSKPQRFHIHPTPRAGGVGIFLAFFLSLLGEMNAFSVFFLVGIFVVFLSGFLEDMSASLSPKKRLFIQLLGALIVVFGMGVVIEDLSPIITLPYFLAIAFSLFGIIGVCNAINIIDGFNGLAGGICLMAFVAIGIGAYSVGLDFVLLASMIGIGAVLGFLSLNFPKGKIFLGDGGAYMLGFVLAILLGILTQESEISAWFGLCVMIYPVWEVVFSIIRRLFNKQATTQPDRKHLHTLIYQKTQSNSMTAVMVWIFNLPFMILSVVFIHQAWVLIGICIAFIMFYSAIYYFLRSNQRNFIQSS